jgi:hypothetical protein
LQVHKGAVTLKLFGKELLQLLSRHPLNDRQQVQVLEEYVKSVLEQGCIPGVRGICCAVERPGSDDNSADKCYWLLSWGTLVSAIYIAASREPDNAMVQATLATGVEGAVVLRVDTPKDVLIFLRDYFNSFHNGSKYSFTELLRAGLARLLTCIAQLLTLDTDHSFQPHRYDLCI